MFREGYFKLIMFTGPAQKVRNMSAPKKIELMNIKNISTNRSLWSCCSLDSSVFVLFPPSLGTPNKFLFLAAEPAPCPKMSSHVKLRVNSAGNRPMPIMKPPLWLLFPNKPLP